MTGWRRLIKATVRLAHRDGTRLERRPADGRLLFEPVGETTSRSAERVRGIATVQSIIARTEPPAPAKNLAAVALGKLGGLKGGKARAAKLSPERRQEIAKKAARARWERS